MSFVTGALCTAGLAAFAISVFVGGFYLLTYRPYAKKKQTSERASAAERARAGGLAALGQPEQRTRRAAESASQSRAPAATHP